MRATVGTILTVFLAGLAVPAVAQRGAPGQPQPQQEQQEGDKEKLWEAKIDEPAPPIKAASFMNIDGDVSLERFKNRIVVLFFFRTDDSPSMDEAVPLLNRLHKEMGSQGVVIIGLTPEKKEKAESIIKGKQIKFAVGFEAKYDETYKPPGPPYVYLITPTSKVANRFHAGDDLEGKLKTQLRQTPPEGADTKSLQNRLRRARQALNDKQIGKAHTLAKDVSTLVEKESSLGRRVADLMEKIDEAAQKWLEEAKASAKAKDHDKAVQILAELSVRFEGTKIGGDADDEIGRLLADREVKPKVKKAKDNAKGELLNDQAADSEASKRYLEALKDYRAVTEKYSNTEAAKTAEDAIERINSDPSAQQIIANLRADEQADRWLDIADRFAKVEMHGQAREYYQRIVEVYPTARATAKARERLEKLPEEEPDDQSEDEPEGTEDEGSGNEGP